MHSGGGASAQIRSLDDRWHGTGVFVSFTRDRWRLMTGRSTAVNSTGVLHCVGRLTAGDGAQSFLRCSCVGRLTAGDGVRSFCVALASVD